METDLEVVIHDLSIIITPAHIKSYILMTLEGLEYLHMNWVLHRVSDNFDLERYNVILEHTQYDLYFDDHQI